MQMCGWVGTYDLFPGGISDSEYLKTVGVFNIQKKFQDNDDGVPFWNIVDRGYRVTKTAWMSSQLVLQPIFTKTDKKFNTDKMLKSVSIAANHSGNE